MNWWIITTIAFVILTFVFALIAGSQLVEVRFERRRTAAQRALYLTAKAENITLLARIADLEEALETAQKTVPVVEAPKRRSKRTEAP